MKSTKAWYWITTSLICALMTFSALGSFMNPQESTVFFTSLGFPSYMVPFLSWAKLLGVIAVLVPGYPRIKEWAYAGLAFDLIGALYCTMMTMPDVGGAVFILVALALLFTSYFLYHRRQREAAVAAQPGAEHTIA
jgi:hypothetical protein